MSKVDDEQIAEKTKPRFAEQELLLKFRKTVSEEKKNKIHKKLGSKKLHEYKSIKLQRVKLRKGVSLEDAIEEYQSDPDVEYAEPNYAVSILDKYPNDPLFWDQWGAWTIRTPAAWGLTTGSRDVVVAVIDSGIDYSHNDLQQNVWWNPGEIPNGIDDDGNGYIDDLHGINAVTGSGDPWDDHFHGTHVAGIIGATGNNGLQLAGVNWKVTMIACKFIASNGYGWTSDAIECFDYLKDLKERAQNPVNIIATNNSWGGDDYSQALHDAIAAQTDILFVAAAGNEGESLDTNTHYPASYALPNVLTVGATENDDSLADYSNFGKRNVDVAAPGSDVISTFPGESYTYLSGTSMAAPHVTGTVALLASYGKDWKQAKNLVLTGGDPVDVLVDRTLSGQRINVYGSLTCSDRLLFKALDLPDSITPGVPVTLSAISINCDTPWAPVTVTVDSAQTISLLDDGVGPDLFADDGVFSASWTPASSSAQTLEFNSPAGSVALSIPVLRLTEPVVVDYPGSVVGENAASTATNVPFRQVFGVAGGLAPLAWNLADGDLPAGLGLDSSSGEITGTLSAPGVYSYSLKVTDAHGTSDVTRDWSLLVNDDIRAEQPMTLPDPVSPNPIASINASPVFADLDGDGKDELIVSYGYSLYVYDVDGLVAQRDFSGKPSTAAVADLDGNGEQEIVVNVGWHEPSPSIYAFRKDLTELPGFPSGYIDTYNGSCGFSGSPVISDLNDDGNLSILAICAPNNTNGANYNKDVVIMTDAQGEMLPGWPKVIGVHDYPIDRTVAVGDLDGDGRNEIVYAGEDGVLRIFNKEGVEVAQWSMFSDISRPVHRPVLADFNGDGQLEIAVRINYSTPTEVIVYDRTGNVLPGWPRSFSSYSRLGLSAADLDNDGRSELVFITDDAYGFAKDIQALRYDGSSLPGWPVTTGQDMEDFVAAPVVGDINGDGEQEILVSYKLAPVHDSEPQLDAFDRYGNRVSGYPKYYLPDSSTRTIPALGDFDGNDRVDIAVKTQDGRVYIWESPQSNASSLHQWPMFGGDPQHSNTARASVPIIAAQARRLFPNPMTFESIGAAYDALADDNTIQVQYYDYVEDILFDKNLSVFLQGGFNADFSANSSVSTINGSVTVGNGTLTVEKIRIR